MVKVPYIPPAPMGLKVGDPANFEVWQDREGRMYCFPEIVSCGALMQFTEIDIDEDGILTDIVSTDICLTRSECRKNGWGSFDNISQEAEK